jgi:4-hydroxy-3-polyprenylbenzoate decarboxylase
MDMAKRIRDLLTGQRAWYTKIIVVDEDVDVFDMGQVMHAFSVKCHSTRGISLLEVEGKGNQLTPCYSRDEREKRMAAIGLFDCTWPPGWPRRDIPRKMSFEEAYSHEVKKTAIAKLRRCGLDWKNLGDAKEEAGHHDKII